jgi:hypothetical protein
MKQQILLGGKGTLNAALRQTLEKEVAKFNSRVFSQATENE